MIRFFRAAGFAAASLVASIGIFHATPSLAWEANAPAVSLPTVSTQEPSLAAPADAAAASAEPVTLANPPAAPVADVPAPPRAESAALDAELECLAGAVYFEAKGEPARGQLSVAKVILNRTVSGRFPRTACGVVKQRGQFSFVRGGRFPVIARGSASWKQAVAIARMARDGSVASPAGKALFFHARYVSPGWRGVTRVAAIGNHVFYR
jgi:spore germination cell wall hydrolase CwlJ-like protein